MSQEITVQITSTLPAHLKEMGYQDTGLAAGILPRTPRLGITTDKVFTFTEGKETQKLTKPDGRPVQEIQVVLLAAANNLTKAYYAKPYSPGQESVAPDCFSLDSKVPAPAVKNPLCTNCSVCRMNAFGSHPVTGRGKACGDRKQLIVVLTSDIDRYVRLNVPTMSMENLRVLDQRMRENNLCQQGVVVQLGFDYAHDYSVITFSPVGYLSPEVTALLREKAHSEEVQRLLNNVYEEEVDDVTPPPPEKPFVPDVTIPVASGGVVPQTAPEVPKRGPGRPRKAAEATPPAQAVPEPQAHAPSSAIAAARVQQSEPQAQPAPEVAPAAAVAVDPIGVAQVPAPVQASKIVDLLNTWK